MEGKISELQAFLRRYDNAVIAFSGGVDSTFLARAAKEIYGDNLLLVTATSSTYPYYELEEAKSLARQLGISHRIIVSEELDIPGYSDNPPDRCYYCKSELFGKIKFIASQEGYKVVFDGTNADEMSDFRPGLKAKKERGVVSPLAETGFSKTDIRFWSEKYELPTAAKQSYSCLASRFPYGEKITREKLDRVGQAEYELRNLGFTQFRIRSHESLARLEFINQEIEQAWLKRKELLSACKKSGFSYVTIDLEGYRTGAMNEVLSEPEKLRLMKH